MKKKRIRALREENHTQRYTQQESERHWVSFSGSQIHQESALACCRTGGNGKEYRGEINASGLSYNNKVCVGESLERCKTLFGKEKTECQQNGLGLGVLLSFSLFQWNRHSCGTHTEQGPAPVTSCPLPDPVPQASVLSKWPPCSWELHFHSLPFLMAQL